MKNKKNPEFHRTGTFLLQFGIDTKDCLYLRSFICMALVGQIEYCEIVQDYVTFLGRKKLVSPQTQGGVTLWSPKYSKYTY